MTTEPFDRESFRKQITKLADSELVRRGKAAREMCDFGFGEAPKESFIVQLEECHEEWKRRGASRLGLTRRCCEEIMTRFCST